MRSDQLQLQLYSYSILPCRCINKMKRDKAMKTSTSERSAGNKISTQYSDHKEMEPVWHVLV